MLLYGSEIRLIQAVKVDYGAHVSRRLSDTIWIGGRDDGEVLVDFDFDGVDDDVRWRRDQVEPEEQKTADLSTQCKCQERAAQRCREIQV